MIKGFFFDLDGTLVDTHQANFEAYKRALADLGVNLTFEAFKSTIGQQAKHFLPELAPQLSAVQLQIVTEKKAAYYKEFAHLSILNQPLFDFMKSMHQHYVTALVTTAKRRNAEVILAHHKMLDNFSFIVTDDDVTLSKPDPEAYLLALQKSGLRPEQVVAFEDSETGQQAAEAAGLAVIKVKDFIL